MKKIVLLQLFTIFAFFTSFSQQYNNVWVDEIKELDSINEGYTKGGILFTGSSSIKFWESPSKDFENSKIIKTGFGGSQIIDLIENFDEVIYKYEPKKIIIYSGDNDIESGKSAEIVFGDFCTLYGMIKVKLPETEVYYISIKPSKNRWSKVIEMRKANTMINEFLNSRSNGHFIDIFSPMIGLNGEPEDDWFIEDCLHMTKEGYELWTKIIGPYIKD